jgi:hypothetical protein
MSHQDRWRWGRGPWSLLAQGCERLAHHLGLGKSTFPCDSLKESGSLRINSDVQRTHDENCITGCNTRPPNSVRALAAGELIHLGEFFG